MSQVFEMDGTEFEGRVLQSPVPVVVDFYAEWCVPCRHLAPVLEELADELAVFKVDVEKEIDLAKRLGISALPTVSIFEKGEEIARLVGLQNKERLMEQIPTIPNLESRSASS